MSELDLNLVRTFVLLYETRNVTRTAEHMSLTQPSVSHALKRLRKHLNDNLFGRSPDGLRPTALAVDIYPRLRQALDVMDGTLSGIGTFDPMTSRRKFRLHATDLGEINLLPEILAKVATSAPNVSLTVIPLNTDVVDDELRHGHADAAICTPHLPGNDLRRDLLRQDTYCGICTSNHPRVGTEPSLEVFLGERHVAVDMTTGHTDVDKSLTALGVTRDVAVRLAHFAPLPQLIESTPYLSIIPTSVSAQFERLADVRTFPLPFSVPGVEIGLYTFRRILPDPGTEWLRTLILSALTSPQSAK
ncbi:LysR family transcriptional regulator [Williamsia soli]|uniref:LysR family transcriptional regulator n=1 Tax=Williamsia soli TaxID=364929 RepID=UPI001A9D34C6|nr:LysR family transcriptional regulator [Williamsia soli]